MTDELRNCLHDPLGIPRHDVVVRGDMAASRAVKRMRSRILRALERQGFHLEDGKAILPAVQDKDGIRNLHSEAVTHLRGMAEKKFSGREKALIRRIADGREVRPENVSPKVVEVLPGTDDEWLFRYAALHWSIPVSSGYGRRLRFLVVDQANEKLIGIMGLADPVFALRARDEWVGWGAETRRRRLRYVMEAFVLGAVPPYSRLLCGKLVAMLAASSEVRAAFRRKYANARSVISGAKQDGELAAVTTASALGKSSIYRRINAPDGRRLYVSCGTTVGTGEFQFINGEYDGLATLVKDFGVPTMRKAEWGRGFRNRREIVQSGLRLLDLPRKFLHHGIGRELFIVPLAENTREFLQGRENILRPIDRPAADIADHFRERWLLPRAEWDGRWREFRRREWLLWGEK